MIRSSDRVERLNITTDVAPRLSAIPLCSVAPAREVCSINVVFQTLLRLPGSEEVMLVVPTPRKVGRVLVLH